ncbi:M50 family metallopeptidase [Paenibacillus antarcticus]|uniref:M50 family peptidase n=1 Tax=Paenibacillus antarcticus TaxID=253703 RepID=A0A168PZQ3_9BACL|nr:M50 family metallopeptidase [Paenibacillus antarcticus]OAB47230.1 hypothetical protein PBAT_05840 [Paenibacillus antarcticus]
MNKWLKTIVILVGSAILTRLIPFSYVFRTVDTMIHEFAHAVVTLLTSGRVLAIQLNPDHSGVTYSTTTSTWSSILVSLAGYTLASLCAALLFYWMSRRQEKRGMVLLTVIAVVMLVMYVHHGYGVFWLVGFIVLNIVMMYLPLTVRNMYYGLLAFLTLEESVLGPIYLVTRSLSGGGRAGDASNLASWTSVPAIFWALLFVAFSLVCAKMAFSWFFNRRPSSRVQDSTHTFLNK